MGCSSSKKVFPDDQQIIVPVNLNEEPEKKIDEPEQPSQIEIKEVSHEKWKATIEKLVNNSELMSYVLSKDLKNLFGLRTGPNLRAPLLCLFKFLFCNRLSEYL